VLEEAEIIPESGQTFTINGYRLRVLRSTPTRIISLEVLRIARPAGD